MFFIGVLRYFISTVILKIGGVTLNKKYYIAYGSNLNHDQMKRRCPDAKLIGTGIINDFQLVFKGSKNNGYATVEPSKNSQVPAGVYEISDNDEMNLDVYEGYPKFYSKKQMTISNGTQHMQAMIYVMNDNQAYAVPSQYYFGVVKEGYKDCHLDEKYLNTALQNTIDHVQQQNIEENNSFGYRDIRQQ